MGPGTKFDGTGMGTLVLIKQARGEGWDGGREGERGEGQFGREGKEREGGFDLMSEREERSLHDRYLVFCPSRPSITAELLRNSCGVDRPAEKADDDRRGQ